MPNKNVLIYSISILAVAVTALVVYKGFAFAEEANKYPPLVQKIVETFNLDQTQVDKLIIEQREIRQTERTLLLTEKLNQAVKDNKITEEQKNTILQKHEEWQASRDQNFGNLSRNEKFAQREAHKQEMQKLETDLRISLKEIMGNGMGMGRNGMKGNWR